MLSIVPNSFENSDLTPSFPSEIQWGIDTQLTDVFMLHIQLLDIFIQNNKNAVEETFIDFSLAFDSVGRN